MKVAIDTNILVRLITADDKSALKYVEKLINSYGSRDIFITYGTLLELYYVLTKYYHYDEEKFCISIMGLLGVEQFVIEQETPVRLALSKTKQGFDFPDCLIGEVAAVRNLKTYTFDRGLKDNSSFLLLP